MPLIVTPLMEPIDQNVKRFTNLVIAKICSLKAVLHMWHSAGTEQLFAIIVRAEYLVLAVFNLVSVFCSESNEILA